MQRHFTASHWGVFEVVTTVDGAPRLTPFSGDPDPSPMGLDQADEATQRLRITRPAVRQSWLRHGPGAAGENRGREPFVEIGWDQAEELVAGELARVRREHGNGAIYGGSYGWSSAGRFHHAQSQVHRFLNAIGGYVRHVDTYSLAAGRVIMPHVVGQVDELHAEHTSWEVIAENTDLLVSFGGIPLKNSRVSPGGAARHRVAEALQRFGAGGGKLVSVGPASHGPPGTGRFEWIAIRPNTDAAMMLALAHELFVSGRADAAFLAHYCMGADRYRDYVLGVADGVAKSPEWAAKITGVPAGRIAALAHEMAEARTMLNVAWSLQRAHHGEQPFWALVALACVLGQIGLPGGGFGLGYGAMNAIGSPHPRLKGPSLPQGANPVRDFIPVARIADMLLQPGAAFTYNGGHFAYPHIRLVYWGGGNPFHHHQDIGRLRQAWSRPETIIVHEQFWNPHARMADIVLPASLAVERNDIGFATREGVLVAMRRVREAPGEARDDYAIFSALSARLGALEAFTEGRDEMAWLRHLYDAFCEQAGAADYNLPDFDRFWGSGLIDFSAHDQPVVFLSGFRADQQANRLSTPSGKIELFSEPVAAAGIEDCPGHPSWLEPAEWLGAPEAADFPLHLVSDQPDRRLHSQLDHSKWSLAGKVDGREKLRLNPRDAAARGIEEGDVVDVFNRRGRCQAAAEIDAEIMPGVVRLATGAWFDPAAEIDAHGNPNMLTSDRPASGFSQGCAALTCLVEVARSDRELAVSAHDLPVRVAAEEIV